jgi:hypothetical protein
MQTEAGALLVLETAELRIDVEGVVLLAEQRQAAFRRRDFGDQLLSHRIFSWEGSKTA